VDYTIFWDVMLCSLVEVSDTLEEYTASIFASLAYALVLSPGIFFV
jgi:hypothetical protein